MHSSDKLNALIDIMQPAMKHKTEGPLHEFFRHKDMGFIEGDISHLMMTTAMQSSLFFILTNN